MFIKGLVCAIVACTLTVPAAHAWDHPGHMLTASIAYEEIERQRPDLMDKIGLLLLKHPDPAPFWVASTDAIGKERTRRMFIEGARWADDAKFTIHDRPTYHSARFAIVTPDASPEAVAMVEARAGEPVGDAIEALNLHARVLSNSEAKPNERAIALTWVMHIIGDIHQPLHVTDLVSADYPLGNAAGTMSYVWDPLNDTAMPLHILWDSNAIRSTKIEDIDKLTVVLMEKYPRASFPQLGKPNKTPDFRAWVLESHQIAIDFAYGYGIKTVPDPDQNIDSDRLIQNMMRYILEGVSHVEDAPKVPKAYWEQLQATAQSQITLAGYRIADLLVEAADTLFAERSIGAQVLDSMQRHGTPDN